jgi:hypothetical protein
MREGLQRKSFVAGKAATKIAVKSPTSDPPQAGRGDAQIISK